MGGRKPKTEVRDWSHFHDNSPPSSPQWSHMNYLSPSVHQDDYSDGHHIQSPHQFHHHLPVWSHWGPSFNVWALNRYTYSQQPNHSTTVAWEGESYLFALMFLVRFCFGGRVGSFSFLNTKIDFLRSYPCVMTRSHFLLAFFSSHISSRKVKRMAGAKPKQWRNAFSYYYQNKWRNCTPDGCTLSIQLKKCLVNRDKWSEMAEYFLAILKK